MRASLLLAGFAAVAACSDTPFPGDPFPIYLDRTGGALRTQVRLADDGPLIPAIIDTLAPFSLLDPFEPGVALPPVRQRGVTLTVMGHRSPGETELVPRARYQDTALWTLHPCFDAALAPDAQAPCIVGRDDDNAVVGAVIGADLLTGRAAVLDFEATTVTIVPDIAGGAAEHALACEAVFPAPFFGGGTLLVGGSEVGFDGLRLALGACLGHAPDAARQSERGTDALFLLSTAIGPTLLARSAYERYRDQSDNAAPAYDSLTETATVRLPQGPIVGRVGRLPRLALVAEASADRSPCRELYATVLLTPEGAQCGAGDDVDCPCEDSKICSTGAAIELAPSTGIEVVIIDDNEPLLQALRAELRPALPELDGILGTDALTSVELDIDYPHARVIGRCQREDGCVARPAITVDTRDQTVACVSEPQPPLPPPQVGEKQP